MAGNAVAMAVGATLLFGASLATREAWSLPDSPAAWGSLVYLVVVGSVVVFVLFLFVVARWTASATSYVWPLLPFVAVPVSAVLLRERVTPLLIVGGALVVAGVYIGAFAPAFGRLAR